MGGHVVLRMDLRETKTRADSAKVRAENEEEGSEDLCPSPWVRQRRSNHRIWECLGARACPCFIFLGAPLLRVSFCVLWLFSAARASQR